MLPSSKVKDEYWLGETVGVGLWLPLPLPLPVGYVGCGCPGAVVGTGVNDVLEAAWRQIAAVRAVPVPAS